jgi:hypothetical protein
MPNAKLCQLIILITVAGCTTQPAKDHGAEKVNAAGADLQCNAEQMTGSMLGKTTVCTTQAQRDAPADVRQSIATQSNRCMTCL